jgi:hypothetical protein
VSLVLSVSYGRWGSNVVFDSVNDEDGDGARSRRRGSPPLQLRQLPRSWIPPLPSQQPVLISTGTFLPSSLVTVSIFYIYLNGPPLRSEKLDASPRC